MCCVLSSFDYFTFSFFFYYFTTNFNRKKDPSVSEWSVMLGRWSLVAECLNSWEFLISIHFGWRPMVEPVNTRLTFIYSLILAGKAWGRYCMFSTMDRFNWSIHWTDQYLDSYVLLNRQGSCTVFTIPYCLYCILSLYIHLYIMLLFSMYHTVYHVPYIKYFICKSNQY